MEAHGAAPSNVNLLDPTSLCQTYHPDHLIPPRYYSPSLVPHSSQPQQTGDSSIEEESEFSNQDIEDAMFLTDIDENVLIETELPSSSQQHQYDDDDDDGNYHEDEDSEFVECRRIIAMKCNPFSMDGVHHSMIRWGESVQPPATGASAVLDMEAVRKEESSHDQSHMKVGIMKRPLQKDDGNHQGETLSSAKKRPLKKRRKRKTKHDNNGMPKRPLSAYNLFFQAKRAEIIGAKLASNRNVADGEVNGEKKSCMKDDSGGLSVTNNTGASAISKPSKGALVPLPQEMLGKHIGRLWRELDPNEKKSFQDKARREYERYRREMEVMARNRSGNIEKEAHIENNNNARAVSVIGTTATTTSSTAPIATMVTPSNSPAHSTRRLDITRSHDASYSIRASNGLVRSSHGHSPAFPAGVSISLFPPPSYPAVPSPHHPFLSPSNGHSSTGITKMPMSYSQLPPHNIVRRVPQAETYYSYFHRSPPPQSPPSLYPHAMAMPPGMEIHLRTNDFYSNNRSPHSVSVHGGRAYTAAIGSTNHADALNIDQTNYNGDDCRQCGVQKYRVDYTFYTMTRSEADSCVDTFLTCGLQANAMTNTDSSHDRSVTVSETASIRMGNEVAAMPNHYCQNVIDGRRDSATITAGATRELLHNVDSSNNNNHTMNSDHRSTNDMHTNDVTFFAQI